MTHDKESCLLKNSITEIVFFTKYIHCSPEAPGTLWPYDERWMWLGPRGKIKYFCKKPIYVLLPTFKTFLVNPGNSGSCYKNKTIKNIQVLKPLDFHKIHIHVHTRHRLLWIIQNLCNHWTKRVFLYSINSFQFKAKTIQNSHVTGWQNCNHFVEIYYLRLLVTMTAWRLLLSLLNRNATTGLFSPTVLYNRSTYIVLYLFTLYVCVYFYRRLYTCDINLRILSVLATNIPFLSHTFPVYLCHFYNQKHQYLKKVMQMLPLKGKENAEQMYA